MSLNFKIDLYKLLSEYSEDVASKRKCIAIRRAFYEQNNPGLVKLAFDTRRINQEEEFNPRRNLQHYQRSEPFITEATIHKLGLFKKLDDVLEDIKADFGTDPAWQDSYARILLGTVANVVRKNQNDGDFSQNTPSIGSFGYLEEILQARYRLSMDDLSNMDTESLRECILNKDEKLKYKNAYPIMQQQKTSQKVFDPSTYRDEPKKTAKPDNQDALIKALLNSVAGGKSDSPGSQIVIKNDAQDPLKSLFGDLRATPENKNVERTVTITIKENIKDEDKSE